MSAAGRSGFGSPSRFNFPSKAVFERIPLTQRQIDQVFQSFAFSCTLFDYASKDLGPIESAHIYGKTYFSIECSVWKNYFDPELNWSIFSIFCIFLYFVWLRIEWPWSHRIRSHLRNDLIFRVWTNSIDPEPNWSSFSFFCIFLYFIWLRIEWPCSHRIYSLLRKDLIIRCRIQNDEFKYFHIVFRTYLEVSYCELETQLSF